MNRQLTPLQGFGFKSNCSLEDSLTVYNGIPQYHILFKVDSSLYKITEGEVQASSWPDAGIRLNATYMIPSLPEDSEIPLGDNYTIPIRVRSHVCDLSGGIVNYTVELSSQTIRLSSNSSEDKFLESM